MSDRICAAWPLSSRSRPVTICAQKFLNGVLSFIAPIQRTSNCPSLVWPRRAAVRHVERKTRLRGSDLGMHRLTMLSHSQIFYNNFVKYLLFHFIMANYSKGFLCSSHLFALARSSLENFRSAAFAAMPSHLLSAPCWGAPFLSRYKLLAELPMDQPSHPGLSLLLHHILLRCVMNTSLHMVL